MSTAPPSPLAPWPAEFRSVDTPALIAAPFQHDVIAAEGPDVVAFLQGQISQDVASMDIDTSCAALVLQPQGKTAGWFRITREADDRFLLDMDGGSAETILARLRRFLLRTNATFTLIPADGLHGWSLRGSEEALSTVASWDPPDEVLLDAATSWPSGHGPHLAGRDLLAHSPIPLPPDVTTVPGAVLDALRICCGVPAMGREIVPEVIPAELGQWVIDTSVSFTKGCYTGQELVARVDSRGGNVPRHLRRILLEGAPTAEVGNDVTVGNLGVVGTLTSVAPQPDGSGWVALAFIRRAVDRGATSATVDTSSGEIPVTILAI